MIVRGRQTRKEIVFNLLNTKQKSNPAVRPRKINSRAKKTLSNGPNKSEVLVPARAPTTEHEVTSCQKGFKKPEEALQGVYERDTESLDTSSDEEPTPKKKAPELVLSPPQKKKSMAEKTTVKVLVRKWDKNVLQKTLPKKQKSKAPRKRLFSTSSHLLPESSHSAECTAIRSPEVVTAATKDILFETISDGYKNIGKCLAGI